MPRALGTPEGAMPKNGAASPALRIIAVAAAEGGLSAVVQLVRHWRSPHGNGGLESCLVLVPRLDAAGVLEFVRELSSASHMPVMRAEAGARLEPRRVYVVAPTAGLVLRGGCFTARRAAGASAGALPADAFFESLAAEQRSAAVGVVLSGSGVDGAAGVRAIKAAGGTTFAQDGSASHRSAPGSAAATGDVDFVLAPDAIGRALTSLCNFSSPAEIDEAPREPRAVDQPRFVGEALARLVRAVEAASAIDFSDYRPTALQRAAERRSALRGIYEPRGYVALVESDAVEANELAEDSLVGITSFFRDPQLYELLEAKVFPRFLDSGAPDEPLRIWVPGCSTGEEVYSLGISLMEFLEGAGVRQRRLQLFGTDVSQRAIERARLGRFPESITRDVSPARLAAFFVESGGGYQICNSIRNLCVFARQDVARDPSLSRMTLVSCRNLLIYFRAAAQAQLLSTFHCALREGGVLVLGRSESVDPSTQFIALDRVHRVFQRAGTRDPVTPRLPPSSGDDGGSRLMPAAPERLTLGADPLRRADRLLLEHFAPPALVITDQLMVAHYRGDTGPYLAPVRAVGQMALGSVLREELHTPALSVIERARRTRLAAATTQRRADGLTYIRLEAIPFEVAPQRTFFLLILDELGASSSDAPGGAIARRVGARPAGTAGHGVEAGGDVSAAVIAKLEHDNELLTNTNQHLTAREARLERENAELALAQAKLGEVNRELRATIEDLAARSRQAFSIGEDLSNLLASAGVPLLLLSADLRVRRFTPAAAAVFELHPLDIGQPLRHRPGRLARESSELAAVAQARESAVERTVSDETGRSYQLTIRPFITDRGRSEGAVVTALDIDDVERAAERLARARRYAEDIIDTIRECLLVLDDELSVRAANRAFYEAFRLKPEDVLGVGLHRVSGGELGALQALLDGRIDGERPTQFRWTVPHAVRGERIYSVNVRGIPYTRLILIALADVTEQEAAERARLEAQRQEQLRLFAIDVAMAEERERRRIRSSCTIVWVNRSRSRS